MIANRKVNYEEWNLDGLMNMIEKEVSARERALSSGQTPRKLTRDLPTATTLYPTHQHAQNSHIADSPSRQIPADLLLIRQKKHKC